MARSWQLLWKFESMCAILTHSPKELIDGKPYLSQKRKDSFTSYNTRWGRKKNGPKTCVEWITLQVHSNNNIQSQLFEAQISAWLHSIHLLITATASSASSQEVQWPNSFEKCCVFTVQTTEIWTTIHFMKHMASWYLRWRYKVVSSLTSRDITRAARK